MLENSMVGNEVTLRDGRTVTVHDDPQYMPKVGETGFVPEETVLPDPEQPRTTTGILDTEEHMQFSASIERYGQGMIMKVRMLTEAEIDATIKEGHPRARYMVVDGERRFHAIGKNGAGLGVYEITVRAFKEKRDVFLQQVVDNTMQAPLNTPDLARALRKIQREYGGVSAYELASMVNMGQTLVNDCLHIANLPDDLIQFTNENTYNRRRRPLTRKPAVALSRITEKDGVSSHDRQRKIWQESQDRKIKGATALTAFFEQFHSDAVRSHAEKRRPKRMLNRLEHFIRKIVENDLLHAVPDDLSSMLTTFSNGEVTALIEQAQEACVRLAELVENMQEAASSRLPANLGRIDANTATNVAPRAAPAQRAFIPHTSGAKHIKATKGVSDPPIDGALRVAKPRSVGMNVGNHFNKDRIGDLKIKFPITTQVWDFIKREFVEGVVRSPKHYTDLHKAKLFPWLSVGGVDRPDNIPNIDQVQELMNRR